MRIRKLPTGRAFRLAAMQRIGDGAGLKPVGGASRTLSLSNPIVSTQDGARMAGLANFKGKHAAPFGKGAASAPGNVKRNAAKTALARRNAAKAALRSKSGK